MIQARDDSEMTSCQEFKSRQGGGEGGGGNKKEHQVMFLELPFINGFRE